MENLNMRIEQDGDGWIAVLPPHPDMPDEELGLPAATEEEALAEARAYRAIEQSSLYKFNFDEDKGVYVVRLGPDERYDAPLLADAYKQAQEAYAQRVNVPPTEEEPQPAPPRRGRPPKPKPNGETTTPTPTPQPVITSGRQPQPEPESNILEQRVIRLEKLLVGLVEAMAQAIEDVRRSK